MFGLIASKLRAFAHDTKANASVEAVIIFPVVFWAYAAMFTYFDAYRSQAVAEKSAYTVSDMLSRETDPVGPTYIENSRKLYRDLSGLDDATTSLRVTLLQWSEVEDRFFVDWSHTAGKFTVLENSSIQDWKTRLPTLVDNERLIIVETATEYTPAFEVGISSRTIDTFVYTRPRFAPQIVWDGGNDANYDWGFNPDWDAEMVVDASSPQYP